MRLTPAEEERLALKFREVIKDPDFIVVMKDIKEDYGRRILAEESQDIREGLWNEARALDRLGGRMLEFCNVANIADRKMEEKKGKVNG